MGSGALGALQRVGHLLVQLVRDPEKINAPELGGFCRRYAATQGTRGTTLTKNTSELKDETSLPVVGRRSHRGAVVEASSVRTLP